MICRRFEKRYYQGWTVEEFEISKAFIDDPPYHKIKDLKGTILEGTFYEHELQKVEKTTTFTKLSPFLKNENVRNIKSIL